MSTGLYMIQETGEIILWLECPWDEKEGIIVVEKDVVVKIKKTPRFTEVLNSLYYIGEYL